MFVSFDSLPDQSRLWVYQSDRKLSSSDKDIISQALEAFTQQWEVHGKPMKASFKIYFDQFIMLAADESYNEASGCSIDGSVRTFKNLSAQLNIDFLNRNLVAFKSDEEVLLVRIPELNQKRIDGQWNKDTLVFNNLISTKGDIDKAWLLPAGTSWLKRYLPRETVKQ